MNIYFICTGNTCRSPMATAILKSKNLPNVSVKSAGIYAQQGSPMSQNAQYVLNQKNIIHEHQSMPFTLEDAQWADVILTMTTAHKDMIKQISHDVAHKTFTLKEYIAMDGQLNVQDPYGGHVAIYEQTYEELNEAIDQLVNKLRMGE